MVKSELAFLPNPEEDNPNFAWINQITDFEGYNDAQEWLDALQEKREKYKDISAQLQEKYADYITAEEIAELDELEQACVKGTSLAEIEENANRINEIIAANNNRIMEAAALLAEAETVTEGEVIEAEAEIYVEPVYEETYYEEPVYYEEPYYEEPVYCEEPVYYEETYVEPTYNTGSNFMSDGVWYDDNYRYTWYSSNQLYHYRTEEWTPDENGIYRDADGYAVVASSDYGQGTIIEDTPFGAAKVYDSGCASGTLDVYTNF